MTERYGIANEAPPAGILGVARCCCYPIISVDVAVNFNRPKV